MRFFIYFSLNIDVSDSKNVLSTSVSWRSSIQSSTLIRSRIFFWISGSLIHTILVLNASRNSISGLYFSEKRFQFGSERRMDEVCCIIIYYMKASGSRSFSRAICISCSFFLISAIFRFWSYSIAAIRFASRIDFSWASCSFFSCSLR